MHGRVRLPQHERRRRSESITPTHTTVPSAGTDRCLEIMDSMENCGQPIPCNMARRHASMRIHRHALQHSTAHLQLREYHTALQRTLLLHTTSTTSAS